MLRYTAIMLLMIVSLMILAIPIMRGMGVKKEVVDEKIKVVTTLEAFAGIVKAIVGNYAYVDFIVPDGVSPHEYSLTPSDEQKIANADLIVLSNSELFSLESKIKEKFPEKTYLDFEDYQRYGLQILPAPGIEKNYHGYWLYPKNAIAIGMAIRDVLKILDPQRSTIFENNFDVFQKEVLAFEQKMIDKAKEMGIFGKGALLAVPGVAYVAYSYGLIPKRMLLKAPGTYVSAGELSDIVNMIKKKEIVIGLCPESLRESKPGELMRDIQSQVDFPVAYVRIFSLGGINNYIALLAYNYAIMSNVNIPNPQEASTSELLLYVSVGFVIITIIAIVEALVIFNYRRIAERVLYE